MSDPVLTIRVLYSCQMCALKDAAVDVPARGDEDVKVWMDATVLAVWRDHWKRSPRCRPNVLTEMKIPVSHTDRIGGPPLQ